MSYSEKLKALRGTRTQEELASAIGITKSSWSMYERGERMPRDEVKIKISRFFGRSVEELFFSQLDNQTNPTGNQTEERG